MDIQSVFITKLQRNGNSLSIVIPREILKAFRWERGDMLIFGFAGVEQLFIKRITDKELQELKPKEIPNE